MNKKMKIQSGISVIIPIYNTEPYLKECLKSVLYSTYTDIEIICINDGSTDGSSQILEDIAAKDSGVKIINHATHMGVAISRNTGIEASTKPYIAFVDSDDCCVPERFECQLAFLEDHPEYDLVGCAMIRVDDHGKQTYSHPVPEPTAGVLPLQVPFGNPTIMIRRSAMEKLGGYKIDKKIRRSEDLEFWYRFFAAGMKGYNLPDYLYIKNEGLANYKQRKVIYGWEMFCIHLRGLKLIKAPVYKYVLAIKPFLTAMIPKRLMMFYHGIVFRKNEDGSVNHPQKIKKSYQTIFYTEDSLIPIYHNQ